MSDGPSSGYAKTQTAVRVLWAVEGRPGAAVNDRWQPLVRRSAPSERVVPHVADSNDRFLQKKSGLTWLLALPGTPRPPRRPRSRTHGDRRKRRTIT
jgi:hypothetical protein